jgi:cytochrome P450
MDDRVAWSQHCAIDLAAYLREHIEQRRSRSSEDDPELPTVLDVLLDRSGPGSEIADDDVVRIATQVLLAGIDTTATTLCNMVARLGAEPGLRQLFADRPDVRAPMIDEMLRLDPLITVARVATTPLQLCGRDIAVGDPVMVLTGAAARDPDVYDDPSSIVLDRGGPPHLSWGVGAHKCLGMHLAMMELRVMMDAIHESWTGYSIPPNAVVRRHAGNLMGIYSLPLRVQHRPS